MDNAMIDGFDQIIDLIGCDRSEIILASGKNRKGSAGNYDRNCKTGYLGSKGDPGRPLQALIFDSVLILFRHHRILPIMNGVLQTKVRG